MELIYDAVFSEIDSWMRVNGARRSEGDITYASACAYGSLSVAWSGWRGERGEAQTLALSRMSPLRPVELLRPVLKFANTPRPIQWFIYFFTQSTILLIHIFVLITEVSGIYLVKICDFVLIKMAPTIESIGGPLGIGEGPYWDNDTQMLYYVDIVNHSLHSYNQKTNAHYSVDVVSDGNPVSLIVKIKEEKYKFLIAVKNNLAIVSWDGVSSKPLVPEVYVALEGPEQTTRLNDGKCDPSHRLWAGTMGPQIEGTNNQFEQEKGSLYCLHKNKKVVKHLSKIGISNGLAWSLDKKKFYYIDSLKYKVDSYDYDDTTGSLANEKTIFCFKKNNIEGLPDGMTIDAEGMLWVACFGGAQVLRIDPNSGELKLTLKMPSLQITSVAFGGDNLDTLYVTSAKVGFTADLESQYPLAGHTFRVTGLNVRGTPSVPIHL